MSVSNVKANTMTRWIMYTYDEEYKKNESYGSGR